MDKYINKDISIRLIGIYQLIAARLFLRKLHFLVFLLFFPGYLSAQKIETVSTKMSARQAYDEGFVNNVMRTAQNNGVQLNNLVLFENDAAGAGLSLKGAHFEAIDKGTLVRKSFILDDNRALRAHIVLYLMKSKATEANPAYYIVVNGERIEGILPSWHEPMWRWIEVPTSLLKKGLNEVIVGSDASKGEGYELLFAREDEYEDGGGKLLYQGNTSMLSADQLDLEKKELKNELSVINIGGTSAKSLNGGKTWIEGKLGPKNNVSGEYTIRINLERYKYEGNLTSPVIDLWDGLESYPVVKPICKVDDLKIITEASIPKGTEIVLQWRKSDTKDVLDSSWENWKTLDGGEVKLLELGEVKQRYVQWRAILKTTNPLVSPIIKEILVNRKLSFNPVASDIYYVRDTTNVKHRYASFKISYEDAKQPELKLLRERLKLDSVISGAKGDFEKINRIRHYVSGLWYHDRPIIEYPEWNAHRILDRNERLGAGGMCIQFSIVFMQALQSLGYQARHINVFAHETIEVYVDELGDWVHVDPESVFDSYEYNTITGKPLNALDQHDFFLKELGFSSNNPINWTALKPWAWYAKGINRVPQPVNFSTFTANINNPNQPPPQHALVGFIRFIPRSNFLSQPTPRPINHGLIEWPWNGYVNWYDEATPRKLQFAIHTDRIADFYPTINRVEYSLTYTESEGEIQVDMLTFTPNFEIFEVNMDGQGWQPSENKLVWKLRPSALNTIEMRSRNSLGQIGKSSKASLFWHYSEPYKP